MYTLNLEHFENAALPILTLHTSATPLKSSFVRLNTARSLELVLHQIPKQ